MGSITFHEGSLPGERLVQAWLDDGSTIIIGGTKGTPDVADTAQEMLQVFRDDSVGPIIVVVEQTAARVRVVPLAKAT